MKNQHKILLSILLFISVTYSYSYASDSLYAPIAKKGILDLRSQKIADNEISFNGEWAMYWHQLIKPDSLMFYQPVYTAFPVLWNDTKINGKILPSKGYATYAVTVLLPHNREPLAIKIPDVYTSYRLYINGNIISENGKPGVNAEDSKPWWSNEIRPLPVDADTLHIVWQIANFSHSKGGTNETLTIANKKTLIYEKDKTTAFDFLLTGCLFMGGLFFFGLYMFGRYDKTLLFFSLFCMAYSYRIIGTGEYSLHAFIEGVPWWVTIRLEYFSLYLAELLLTLYVLNLYPKQGYRLVSNVIVAISALFCLSVWVLPAFIFTMFFKAFLAFSFLNIIYTLLVFINAVSQKITGSIYSLISAVILIFIFVYIGVAYIQMFHPNGGIIITGYILFFFLQSLILSYRFAHNLKKSKRVAEKALLAKSQFLSTMSHEIRTPLNAVIGLTHLMLKNNPRKDQEEELKIMLFSANNLLSIVNDILDYNKIEAGKIHFECIETNMSEIIKNIAGGFKNYADEKRIGLEVNTDKDIDVTVLADPTRTSQVLNNLVHNAIKFTAKGYVKITLSVEARNNNTITLRFSVKDSGIGIPVEKQRIIFDRFTQADSSTSRSFGGTGLGLSICKSILEKQGCQMQLESVEGSGAEFYFVQTFPICKKIVEEKKEQKLNTNKPLQGVNILLVEDSEFNVVVATRFLQSWGAEIDVAQNGQEALDKFNEHKHKLILMDIHMPVMDGRDATIELRKKGTKVPIIALTASIYADENEKVIACGANDIVLKPFEPESLRNKLVHYLKTAS